VKHLGLSRAHGEVSAYAELRVGFRYNEHLYHHSDENYHGQIKNDSVAVRRSCESSINSTHKINSIHKTIYTANDISKSTAMPNSNNPKWSSSQTPMNKSIFQIPLRKGTMPQDGMKIYLSVMIKEERTTADILAPGILKGGSDVLGFADIDLTQLVMKQSDENTDVIDEWVCLEYNDESDQSLAPINQSPHSLGSKNNKKSVGKVRFILSYEPNGYIPQRGDIVALESFARRQPSLSASHLIVPPLTPLQVIDFQGEYFLVSFKTLPLNDETNHVQKHCKSGDNEIQTRHSRRSGRVRLHRNTIFVIERKSFVDSAISMALTPTDAVLSTSIGQNVSNIAQPYVEAGGELIMPAVLSGRLLLEAAKVGSSAFIIGLKSACFAVVKSKNPERRRKPNRSSYSEFSP